VRTRWIADVAALSVLLVAYSPLLAYDFGHHADYTLVIKPVLSPDFLPGWWNEFFIHPDAPYLVRIGRLLNAILLSLQCHLFHSVESLTPIRGFYVGGLAATYLLLACVLTRHFGLSVFGARLLSLLYCLTPVMQQGVYLVTFSAPFFVSLWTGAASYLVLVPAILRTRVRRETARFLGATAFMLLSLSCYPMGSMVFAAFALLELVTARKVGGGRSVSPIRFTVRVLIFLLLSMVVFVVVDRTIYLIVFANNPLMESIALERFYTPSFSYHGLWPSLEARLYNFWICYVNAAALWDAGVHRMSIVIVTLLLVLSFAQPLLPMVVTTFRRPAASAHRAWREELGVELQAVVCKSIMFVVTVLPFLVPGIRAGADTGYHDAFRTLPAIELGLLIVLYSLFQKLPLTILAPQVLSARFAFAVASRGRTISAIAMGVVVVVATALAFRGINVGAIWATTQYEFYRSLQARLTSGDLSSLVVPCGHGRAWQWISPGIPAEYGYTSIGWERYIQNQLEQRSSPVSLEITCAWERTEFEEGDSYVRQEGQALVVDYMRFIRDFSRHSLERQWALPFVHHDWLAPAALP
jgi:hypothetical protein